MTNAIVAEGLTKKFGDFTALGGVSFEVPQGTVFGLLGPNGAGKTTTIRILATVLKPDGGTARILGYDVATNPNDVRYRIGLAGQFAAVDQYLTGRENLQIIGQLSQMKPKLIKARADELLEAFRLTAAATRPAKTYSGGMRRRLDVAAALMCRPQILFLDEPTSGLDPHSRNELWEMIRDLVNTGTTVLLTTQYLEEADQLADDIAVVDDGLIIAHGTPEQLKSNFGSTMLEFYYDTDAQAEGVVVLLAPRYSDHVERDRNVARVRVTDSVDALEQILPKLQQSGNSPTRLVVREPSLDDVFLSLTGKPTDAGEVTQA